MGNARATERSYSTWALGTLAVFLFAVEVLTGVGLTFHYRPVVATAWSDLVDLRAASAFAFLRPLHFWGSHLLVVAVWLHLLRAFASGLYRPPRQGRWTLGVVLLVATLGLAWTGALLPWDAEARGSIAVWEPTVSGLPTAPREIGDETLWRFYALHCGLLPVLTCGLIVQHLRLARRHRSSISEA